ncbi:helix-turn-helix transcriptional regulator [Nonlabens sp. Asnod3-H03]|uniref:helix-turn-helix transcriptional regulator n=1 Tax=Nonlabens sp. Asnod3-H03 TaxID=3160580 RepID=UPI0038686D25
MAVNKNALLRYKTIDKCLQNTYRTWTLADLVAYCSQTLYDYEGRDVSVSTRTVQLDIQMMRSDKLGYNAPIEVYDRKYYRYSDPNYTITDIPVTEADMSVLTETMEMLRQFKDFSFFDELKVIINKLQDKIHTENSEKPSIIYLEKNENLKGLDYLDELYQAILKEVVIILTYQSFKARQPQHMTFHPQFLREYNNRWFVIGLVQNEDGIRTLALDRIIEIDYDLKIDYQYAQINPKDYYKNTVGVTVLDHHHTAHVVFKVNKTNAPYIVTKPFHHSQEIISLQEDGSMTFQIFVNLNFELERLILGFGESIEVLKPRNLRQRIKRKTALAARIYQKKNRNE